MSGTDGRDLAALPKGHLHLHLEAAMRPGTLADLAAEHGVPVPEIGDFGDFSAFEATYEAVTGVLRREQDMWRLLRELVEDARADGAWYVEPALYAPAHRQHFGSDDQVVELVIDGLRVAGAELGVGVGLMIAGDRMHDPSECEDESIEGALEALGADRVQHGVRAIESPDLVRQRAERGICLDVCPTSNAALGVYPNTTDHPLPALLSAGVRCSLNADDPLLFGCGLLEEYELCRTEMALDDAIMAAIATASLESSGAPADLVERGLAAIREWLADDVDTGAGTAAHG